MDDLGDNFGKHLKGVECLGGIVTIYENKTFLK